jgi:cytochrome c oxidase subunit 4
MSSSDGHGEHSHGGVGKYMMVFFALCGLTTLSFFTYSRFWPFQDTPVVGWVFMMAVSCTKAMLVICFFMHLIWEANWKYVLTIPASLMSVFLVVALVPDVGQRTRYYAEERSLYASDYEGPEEESAADNGAAGGDASGGNADGGNADGGNADGGNADGGNSAGVNADGGAAAGGESAPATGGTGAGASKDGGGASEAGKADAT